MAASGRALYRLAPQCRLALGRLRRFLAPEVIQTSAMDCGPAALKCLLEGFGVSVSYGRLREACQTSVDGTSIDTLETLAQSLGLDAEQVMVPVDHLLRPQADALPALVVMRLPSGLTHFVVVWRAHGGWVQVMDPARGRRWVRAASFLREVYTHSLVLPADAFREWAGSESFTGPLAERLRALQIDDGAALVARALGDPGWSAIAALDRAVRAVEELATAGAVARGAEAAPAGRGAGGRRRCGAGAAGTPAGSAHATATAAAPAEDGSAQVTVRGAVLLQVSGAAALDEERRAALPRDLRAAVDEPRVRVGAELVRLLREGQVRWRALAAGVALAAVGTVVEAVLFRALFDRVRARVCSASSSRCWRPAALELPLAWGLRRAGAAIEEKFRDLFMRKIPRLGDRYFQSRPVSDMAERAHLVHKLRALPTLAGDILRTALEIVVIAIALVWLDPRGAILAIALAAAMLAIPLLAEPAVAERDLRMRNHAGALGRFYLDALLGLVTIRTHGAAPALVREHQDRLHEWVRAARAALRAALGAEALQALVGFGLAAWLLVDFFGARGRARRGRGAARGLLDTVAADARVRAGALRPAGARAAQPDVAPGRAARRARGARGRRARAGDRARRVAGRGRRGGDRPARRPRRRGRARDPRRGRAGDPAGRARRDRRRIGRGEVEPGGSAAGLAPARGGDGHRRRRARSDRRSWRRCASAPSGSTRACTCGTDRSRPTSASGWNRRPPTSRPRLPRRSSTR